MLEIAEVGDLNWGDLQKSVIEALIEVLSACRLDVNGKSTFKDEFVTAGGVELSEINFKTMEHQRLRGLHFAGEVLSIDAITGGFNFQAAWTTSYIAAEACGSSR
jgi:predicted flavoprotein YhiN